MAFDLEPLYAEEAKKRQGERTDLKPRNIVPNSAQVNDPPPDERKSRAKAAKAVGARPRGQ